MPLRDFTDAIRRRAPEAGGDGKCLTPAGKTLDLELYKFDSCPYCQRVFRAVRELGVPVRYRDIAHDDEAARRLVEVGKLDQVPCLFVDGKPMYESADIVAFLERNFAKAAGTGSVP